MESLKENDELEKDECEVCAGLGYIQGIDTICPHCRGEGYVDWIEQITGKREKIDITNTTKWRGYL